MKYIYGAVARELVANRQLTRQMRLRQVAELSPSRQLVGVLNYTRFYGQVN